MKTKKAEEVKIDTKLVNQLPVKKPKEENLQLKKYQAVIDKLDNSIEHAMDVLIDLLDSDDENIRLRTAELLLKKYLPDKKSKEKEKDKVVQINIDKRENIVKIVGQLDDMSYEELRERAEDGNIRLFDSNAGTEIEAEGEVEGETEGS